MYKLKFNTFIAIFLLFAFIGCSKKKTEPVVIIPTINPLPYTVQAYLITPTDKKFNAQYYTAVKSAALSLQTWYKNQMGNKTFTLNPGVVDTLSGLHEAAWYNAYNGDSISGSSSYSYHNTLYDIQQLLGSRFNTTNFDYFVFVDADFPDETIPRGLAAEGLGTLSGIAGQYPNSSIGAAGHALGHSFGLPEVAVVNPNAIMSTGYPQYPNCILQQPEKDSLNASPFFSMQ
jgi:hypothetical protein